MGNYTTRYSLHVGALNYGNYNVMGYPIFKEEAGVQYPQIYNEDTQQNEDDLEHPYYNNYGVSEKPAHQSHYIGRELLRLQKVDPEKNFINADSPYDFIREGYQKHTINFRRQQMSFDVVGVDAENVTVVSNFARKDWDDEKDPSNVNYPKFGGYGFSILPVIESQAVTTPFVGWLAGEDVNFGSETSDTRVKARFGASPKSKERMVRNPFFDKKYPKLKAAKEDSLIFVCELKKTFLIDGGGPYYGGGAPYGQYDEVYTDYLSNGFSEDSFFSLKSIDAQEYQNKDNYVVINMGNFKFENGLVYDMEGPFNIDVDQFPSFFRDNPANES